jgi:tetratricopeptide (TPR) repeat protein
LDGVAKASNNLGALAYFEGDWERAANWYRRAIAACRRSGNEIAAAVTASNLGELLVSRRQFDDARSILGDAIRILRAARSVDDLFFAELQVGRLLLEEGAYDDAAAHLARVRDEAAAVGQSGYAFEAAALGACALVGRARYDLALEVLDEAARAAGEVDVVYQPLAARASALALMGLGRTEEALAMATQGCSIARDQELLYDEALLLSTIDEIRGETSPETLALFDKLGIPVPVDDPATAP